MVEQQQVRQSGDIFKKIMEGQKQFFNGQNRETDSTGSEGETTS
jgi:hypothetical protein